ncbi:hypothetical protein [Halopiger xanaduensis]|uniref:hypothetical protein n=1 Tax=Halopiger xanaduensis TaxID=387343 RepID=UPI0006775B3C|nr:hypothetical protein [Halopiger xanaduensis]
MSDVIHAYARSDRLLLAASFACFAVAGLATAAADATGATIGATALAVVAVYGLAQYANRVTRRTLAHLSLALWIGFLGVAGLHAVGLETVGAAVPGPSGTVVQSLTAVTWATFLTASTATAFLGFREYGASQTHATEDYLESDTSDYSTR